MDNRKNLILIKGSNKTESIASFRFHEDYCDIVYDRSPDKTYTYKRCNVVNHPIQKVIDPTGLIVTVRGCPQSNLDEILDFGEFYRLVSNGAVGEVCRHDEVSMQEDCLHDPTSENIFECFKETAAATSLVAENGTNILSLQYDRIQHVSSETVLANYLNPQKSIDRRALPPTVIYPFGLNQSQKKAVERALSSQISIIQGPPGTGKTQTILNIIANVVLDGKTVAVVSNNNSATHNVAEKLEKKNFSFLTAFLGSNTNKKNFIETQNFKYPDMEPWKRSTDQKNELKHSISELSSELNEKLHIKNRIAEIEQEFLCLEPEQHYFEEYYASYKSDLFKNIVTLSSDKILSLWMEFEHLAETEKRPSLLQKFFFLFRFNFNAIRLFRHKPEIVIPYLQHQFYITKQNELHQEKEDLEQKLFSYSFSSKMDQLTEMSLELFRSALADRYDWTSPRPEFIYESFRRSSQEFTREYPVILSTTYSIKGTLDSNYLYDYLIIDEASQVDLTTGVLAFSCARNVVIVGDLKQLPNVVTDSDARVCDEIWQKRALPDPYRFSKHSLLSSVLSIWRTVPVTLLKEHYRCHPKIINFCNQKFYQGQLIIMTEDHNESNVLTLYQTAPGNHARKHSNQRQIDVIQQEILPRLSLTENREIGIITPYRDQVSALRKQLGDRYEVDTVHKFQGREKDDIILTSVDNVISDFVDDPHMLNVAVSRAVHSLTVVTSHDPRNDQTNYGDLLRYILYNNFQVIQSRVYSVFDLLYKGYAEQRKLYLQKHKRISEYDSENLMYALIDEILSEDEFAMLRCATHVSLATLVKDYSVLTNDEITYARNFLTHVDFLLFHRMDNQPVLAIEVDGTAFHGPKSSQSLRDSKKNSILEKCDLPLLRLRTDGSGERDKIITALRSLQSQTS